MTMMKMTAMESLKDVNMMWLDLLAGLGGSYLTSMMTGGLKMELFDVIAVLLARGIVDYAYAKGISETDKYGGTLKELFASSIMWFIIQYLHCSLLYGEKLKIQKLATKFCMTLLVMLAVARLTGWG